MGKRLDVIPLTQPRCWSVASFGLSAEVNVSRPKRAVRVFILSPFLLRVDLGENDSGCVAGRMTIMSDVANNSPAATPWNRHPPPKTGKVDCRNRLLVHHLTAHGPASSSAPSTRHTPRIGFTRAVLQAIWVRNVQAGGPVVCASFRFVNTCKVSGRGWTD